MNFDFLGIDMNFATKAQNSRFDASIAIVGATGIVGREIIKILAESNFPIKELRLLASAKSSGKKITFNNSKQLIVENLADFDFSRVDLAFFTAGAEVSAQYAPQAAKNNCIVIDNTSHFRMDPNIPLIVPEVNLEALELYKKSNIIANPNCSTIQMVVALKPLHDNFNIERIIVSTYQATSGAGTKAQQELLTQTKNLESTTQVFPKQIAYNVIPQIDKFLPDGSTKEEWKMVVETKKILDNKIRVHANCARIGSLNCHAEYINIETSRPITVEGAIKVLQNAPGIKLVDSYVTPIEISGKNEVYISRLRQDESVPNGLSFWCVADNLRKGAALNSIQIAMAVLSHKPKSGNYTPSR